VAAQNHGLSGRILCAQIPEPRRLGFPGVMEPKTALRCSVLWTALTPRV
jgi:hypothetical protein